VIAAGGPDLAHAHDVALLQGLGQSRATGSQGPALVHTQSQRNPRRAKKIRNQRRIRRIKRGVAADPNQEEKARAHQNLTESRKKKRPVMILSPQEKA